MSHHLPEPVCRLFVDTCFFVAGTGAVKPDNWRVTILTPTSSYVPLLALGAAVSDTAFNSLDAGTWASDYHTVWTGDVIADGASVTKGNTACACRWRDAGDGLPQLAMAIGDCIVALAAVPSSSPVYKLQESSLKLDTQLVLGSVHAARPWTVRVDNASPEGSFGFVLRSGVIIPRCTMAVCWGPGGNLWALVRASVAGADNTSSLLRQVRCQRCRVVALDKLHRLSGSCVCGCACSVLLGTDSTGGSPCQCGCCKAKASHRRGP